MREKFGTIRRDSCLLSVACCHAATTPDGKGVTYGEAPHIAMAVAMPDGGLITPVLANADTTDIYQMSRNWGDLVKRARTKQVCDTGPSDRTPLKPPPVL